MLLKYLDIQGFKSFPDKTRVTFDRGLTAVVGPNGSGKSNISDAVRWVMGEQSTKTLRGAKMEDVIFAGTKSRKPQGFAEVSLTVDNRNREFAIDSDEVTITRKYYRSGESEYMINRSNVRLKDINEIFMDTGLGKDGYSLVGQGKIAEIVQSKSNERREIFEEAAGISKFRYRKNESERNLAHAEENLVRLRDILSELEGRVGPLKEQSEKAKKFLELSEQKKVLEVSIWNDTLERSNQALKDQSDKIVICNSKRDELEKEISEIEKSMEMFTQEMQRYLIGNEEKRNEKEQLEGLIAEFNAQIAVCNNNILHNKENVARLETEIINHSQAMENTGQEIQAKKMQIQECEAQIAQTQAEIETKQAELLSKSGESQNYTLKQQSLKEEMNQLLIEQSQHKMTETQLSFNIEELTASLARNDIEHKARLAELSKYQEEQTTAKEFLIALNEKLESLQNSFNGHKLKLDNRMNKLNAMKQECDKSDLIMKEKQQKVKLLEGLEQSLEGFAYSVKEVLKRAQNNVLNGICGTVSQVVEVKGEYSVAIETALGGAMQNIIVNNEGDAKAAIRLLQQQNLGRATFLPLTSVSGSFLQVEGLERYAGYVDIASNLVKYDGKYKPVVDFLLGRIVVVDDIDTAVLIAQKYGYKFRIVTLDGQVVNAGGSLTGGSRNKSQGFLSRKNEIQVLQNELAELSQKHQQNMMQMQTLQREVAQIEAEFTAITSEIQTVGEDKIRTDSELKRIGQMVEQVQALNSQMQSELAEKQNKLKSQQTEIEIIRQTQLEHNDKLKAVTEQLSQLEETSKTAVEIQTKLGDELSQLKIKVVTLTKDIEAICAAIVELEKQTLASDAHSKDLEDNKQSLLSKNQTIEAEIQTLQTSIENNKQKIIAITNAIENALQQRQQLEAKSVQLRKKEREISGEKEKISTEATRLEERHLAMQKEYDVIIQKMFDEYELTRSEAQKIAVEIENISKANAELNSYKSKIRNLGSVNVAAIEEYKEVSERYEFLNTQIKDAEKSRNELLRLINELTQKMQDIFSENFEKINENFKKIFVELFGGGRADLKLTDPDNVLESGIEIFVEPPGKIIKNLASLSGGEQAFVAIAIYFAILKVRPAPFCILDEIEAALDDVNVVKYANYLRQMSDKTQFIMITHRRGSMEAADVLYGVTMQDEGVSKLLQLKVSEVENSHILTN